MSENMQSFKNKSEVLQLLKLLNDGNVDKKFIELQSSFTTKNEGMERKGKGGFILNFV